MPLSEWGGGGLPGGAKVDGSLRGGLWTWLCSGWFGFAQDEDFVEWVRYCLTWLCGGHRVGALPCKRFHELSAF